MGAGEEPGADRRGDHEPRIGFRVMTLADLPALVRWRDTDEAVRWLPVVTLEQAQERYGRRLTGQDPTRMLVVQVALRTGWRDVGYLQAYRIGDAPWVLQGQADGASVGLDYVLGEPALMGRGIGTALVGEFLHRVLPQLYPGAPEVLAAPDHRHLASLKVLARNGFRQDLWVDEPVAEGCARRTLVICRRAAGC